MTRHSISTGSAPGAIGPYSQAIRSGDMVFCSGQLGIEGIPTLMAFREGVLVFNQAGALPGPALKQVVDAVKNLDMAEVHAQVAKLQEQHTHE